MPVGILIVSPGFNSKSTGLKKSYPALPAVALLGSLILLYVSSIDKIYPEDEMSKQILLEDERDKIKRKMKHKDENDEKNVDRFGNLLSNITWVSNGAITPFNRQNLHLFDLIDGFKKTDKLLNYKNTMTGLYSGCIEKKKINMNEIHWSN